MVVWIHPLEDVVVILPPVVISLDEIDRMVQALERGIAVATQ
jgi:adenosylmethionine-8-amino-7-oxononanoate aminotransferase